MIRRYFISCPLEAALATYNFGINFEDNEGEPLSFISFHRDYMSRYDRVWYAYGNLLNHQELQFYEKAYVDDNSLHLLGFDDGDVLQHKDGFIGIFDQEYLGSVRCYMGVSIVTDIRNNFRIIRRNGKPFPTVEHEDVE